MAVGGLAATAAALGMGWLIHWTFPVGVAVGLLAYLAGVWSGHRRLQREVHSFLQNTNYLKHL
jgi:hypothetical protein